MEWSGPGWSGYRRDCSLSLNACSAECVSFSRIYADLYQGAVRRAEQTGRLRVIRESSPRQLYSEN